MAGEAGTKTPGASFFVTVTPLMVTEVGSPISKVAEGTAGGGILGRAMGPTLTGLFDLGGGCGGRAGNGLFWTSIFGLPALGLVPIAASFFLRKTGRFLIWTLDRGQLIADKLSFLGIFGIDGIEGMDGIDGIEGMLTSLTYFSI